MWRWVGIIILAWASNGARAVSYDEKVSTRFPQSERYEDITIYRVYEGRNTLRPRTEIFFKKNKILKQWIQILGTKHADIRGLKLSVTPEGHLEVFFSWGNVPYYHMYYGTRIDQLALRDGEVRAYRANTAGQFEMNVVKSLRFEAEPIGHSIGQAALSAGILMTTLIGQPSPGMAAGAVAASAALIIRDSCSRLIDGGLVSPQLQVGEWRPDPDDVTNY